MKWLKAFLLGLVLSSSPSFAEDTLPFEIRKPKVCLDPATYDKVVQQIQDLINSNKTLQEKLKELERLQRATPILDQLEPLQIVIDKEGRVYVKDQLVGKLTLDNLSYDVNLKLKTTIVRAPETEQQSILDLKLKAAILQSYEPVEDETKTFVSYGLALEPIHYHQFSLNVLLGNRVYGAALGVDLTEHMDALVGVGARFNDQKALIVGLGFDL